MKRFVPVIAAVALSLVSTIRAAVLFTDDFTAGAVSITEPGSSLGAGAGKVQALPNGFFRGVMPSNTNFAINGLDSLTMQVFTGSGGFFDYSASSGASGTAVISYGNETPLFIPSGNVMRLDFAGADAPSGSDITVQVLLNPGEDTEYDSAIIPLTIGGAQLVDIPLAVGSGGVSADSFTVFITSPSGDDYRLNSISIQSVPEPAAISALALGGLLLRRKR